MQGQNFGRGQSGVNTTDPDQSKKAPCVLGGHLQIAVPLNC